MQHDFVLALYVRGEGPEEIIPNQEQAQIDVVNVTDPNVAGETHSQEVDICGISDEDD